MADGKIRRMADTLKMLVPGAGIEPAQPLGPRDFKSLLQKISSNGESLGNSGFPLFYCGFAGFSNVCFC